MSESVNKAKYGWILRPLILSLVAMAVYIFIGSIMVAHLTLNDQLFVASGGLFNSLLLELITLIAYLFWLTLILGIYILSRVEKTGSKMKVVLFPLVISVAITLASFGLSILTGGPSQYTIFMGTPFWYYNVNITRLAFHIYTTGAFYSYRLIFDLLFWYLVFIVLWWVYSHVKTRAVPLFKTE